MRVLVKEKSQERRWQAQRLESRGTGSCPMADSEERVGHEEFRWPLEGEKGKKIDPAALREGQPCQHLDLQLGRSILEV